MLLALMALSGFVLDYGVFWVSRGQAQNAADAGALAGVISLADGKPELAEIAARATTKANSIWGEQISDGGILVHVSGEPQPLGSPALPGVCPPANRDCVRVSVIRSVELRNPLPTYFLKLANVMHQEVQATAVARVSGANSVPCLMPLILADRWNDDMGTVMGQYDLSDGNDPYTPTDDTSSEITLFKGPTGVSTPDSFFVIAAEDDPALDDAMLRCSLTGWIGQTVTPGLQNVNFALDENFKVLTDQVVYFPVYDPKVYLESGYSLVRISNIIPFRVTEGSISPGAGGFQVTGTFLTARGEDHSGDGATPPPSGAKFLRSVQLIR